MARLVAGATCLDMKVSINRRNADWRIFPRLVKKWVIVPLAVMLRSISGKGDRYEDGGSCDNDETECMEHIWLTNISNFSWRRLYPSVPIDDLLRSGS